MATRPFRIKASGQAQPPPPRLNPNPAIPNAMAVLRVAAIQAEPVILDAKATLSKACDLIRDAGANGARLAVFPETFVPGYAQWAHSARFEDAAHKKAYARLARNSLVLPRDLAPLQDAARRAGCAIAIGVTERSERTPGTLANTLAYIGADGTFLGKHQKLTPTHHERTVYGYGPGDGSVEGSGAPPGTAVTTVKVDDARIGGLLCWNNYMPLARYALYEQGIHVYLAPTADDRPQWQTAMQFIAQESRAFVISPCLLQRKSSFPEDWELRGDPAWESENEWNERGGTSILGPDGAYLAEPVYEQETILYADLDLDRVVEERLTFDPVGHYGRAEVLGLRGSGGPGPMGR